MASASDVREVRQVVVVSVAVEVEPSLFHDELARVHGRSVAAVPPGGAGAPGALERLDGTSDVFTLFVPGEAPVLFPPPPVGDQIMTGRRRSASDIWIVFECDSAAEEC